MSQTLPERASAVVIGGGVTGASVAWHLAKLGWSDVVLLERRQFASGTSWHAAGLIGTARPATPTPSCAPTPATSFPSSKPRPASRPGSGRSAA